MDDRRVTSEILDLLPPQNLEAERCVLGSILLDSRCLDDVAAIVRPEDFYAEANQRLYGHLLAMHDRGRPIDTVLLTSALRAAGDLEVVGGMAYLAEIGLAVPTAAHAAYYAKLVAEAAKLRSVIHAATEMLRNAYAPGATSDALVAEAEKVLGTIKTGLASNAPVSAQDAVIEAIEYLTAIHERGQHAGRTTGLTRFDADIGGLFGGELVILAARPGIGKTALATQTAYHLAQRGKAVYFASLEMSRVELMLRIACGLANVSNQAIRTGRVADDETTALSDAMREVATSRLWIHDSPQLSAADIRRASRRLDGLAMIVVDYLQLVAPPDRRVQRYEQVGQTTRALKAMARELGVPVLVLCQLNREAEKLDRPTLSNLRESGSIEQDADVVTFLHRPPKPIEHDGQKWDAEWIVAKNRNGPSNRTYRLTWHPEQTRYECWAPDGYPEFDQFGG
jgi:replicative DNA helicase